jgi:hypothetical protein
MFRCLVEVLINRIILFLNSFDKLILFIVLEDGISDLVCIETSQKSALLSVQTKIILIYCL